MIRDSAKRLGGFTLIEVIVALLIVSLGIYAAVTVVTDAARTKTALRDKVVAHWVALNVITDWRSRPSLPPPKVEDSMEMAQQTFSYTLTLSETGFKNLWMMEVRVRAMDSPTVLDTVQGFINQDHLKPQNVSVSWDTGVGGPALNPAGGTGSPVSTPLTSTPQPVTGVGDPNSSTDLSRNDSSVNSTSPTDNNAQTPGPHP